MDSGRRGALTGLRVLDLTQMLAGPFCTQLFADHGAEVIKIEPLDGEDIRRTGPFHKDDALRAFGGYYASVNRNKKSIALNLKDPAAVEVLLKLVDGADALVENFRSGVMDRLGLGYETLQARNPRIVYGAIRGFGDPRTGASPYQDWPAFDVVAQAMGGLMQITGPDADTPLKAGPGVGDIFPAVMCAFGVLAAMMEARCTGQGQFVDVAMTDSVLALCERMVYQRSFLGIRPHPEGNRHPLLAPFGLLRCKDGHVTLAAHTDGWWARLCTIIGRPDLVQDPRTATESARVQHRDVVYGALEEFTSSRTKAQLMELLGGSIPFGPVYNIDEIASDPHFSAREMIVQVPHPGIDGTVGIAGVVAKMSRTPGKVHSRAPLLGEHSSDILESLGYSAHQVADLRSRGAVA